MAWTPIGPITPLDDTRTVKPRSVACNTALGHLNVATIGFIAVVSVAAALLGKGGAISKAAGGLLSNNPSTANLGNGVGSAFGMGGAIMTVNQAQDEVNSACAGQGAGMNPYGT